MTRDSDPSEPSGPAESGGLRVSARAVVVNDADEILLIRHDDGGRVFHVLPGGRQEDGETAAEAVRREVLEETGLTVRVGELRWVREFLPQRHAGDPGHTTTRQQLQLIFDAEPEPGSGPALPHRPDRSQTAAVWHPRTALHTITLQPAGLVEHLTRLRPGCRAPIYLGDLP